MFILRIGAEALKLSDDCLCKDFKHSKSGKMKISRHSAFRQKYSPNNPSILYNLLKQRSTFYSKNDEKKLVSSLEKTNMSRPSCSSVEVIKPIPVKSVALRPSSAPQAERFHPYTKYKFPPNNKCDSTEMFLNIHPEILVLQWLKNMVSIVKSDSQNEQNLWKVLHLSDTDRRNILKHSWHLIFITYLVEFIQANDDKMKSVLGLLIKDYNKTFDNSNYKKLSRLTRAFTVDLETVICQMIELKLNRDLFQIIRVAILFTDRQDDKELKNMELLKPLLLCHSKEYYRQFDEVIDNLFKLDVILTESMLCGHLTRSVENTIDELYSLQQ